MIRLAVPEDATALGMVFYRSVREGPSPYSQAERAAWMPHAPDPDAWAHRLGGMRTILAEINGSPVGFMTLDTRGYIDLAYLLPLHRRAGLFRQMYDTIEHDARALNVARLWTHASLMAQPAFQAMGFHVIHHETVERAGQHLRRAEMGKQLS